MNFLIKIMLSLTQVLILSFVMLFSTTIDDLVVLFTICFNIVKSKDSEEIKTKKLQYTYIGYLLGFSFVITCSLIGLLINHFAKIDESYVALLGFIPICVGVYYFLSIIKEKYFKKKEPLLNLDLNYNSLEEESNELYEEEMNFISKSIYSMFKYIGINETIAHTFCLTFSVGSDNIIIYITFFLQIDYSEIFMAISIFLFISIIYGIAAIKLSKRFENTLKKYSDYIEPIAALAIIGIGAYILSESIIFKS